MSEPVVGIEWNLGATINTGNFSSIRVDFKVSDYVRGSENLQEASNRVYNFVESKLSEKINDSLRELSQQKNKR